jgi:hypothetical protein
VADEAVQELNQLFAKRVSRFDRKSVDLGERLRQSMRDPHVLPSQFPQQLDVMIAGNTKRGPCGNHVANESHSIQDSWTAIDEVADEDRFSPEGVDVHKAAGKSRTAWRHRGDLVAELAQQAFQFIATAVNIPDYVEGTMFVPFVVVKWDAFNDRPIDFLGIVQDKDMAKAFFGEAAE